MDSSVNQTGTENKSPKSSMFSGVLPKLLSIGLLLGALFGLTIFSAILETGQRLSHVHESLAWLFYGLIFISIFWFGIKPMMAIVSKKTRDWSPILNSDSTPSEEWTQKQAQYLLKNANLNQEENRKLHYHITFKKDLANYLREIIEKRSEAMDKVVMNKSKVAFLAVSVSQNGPLDAFLLLTINLSLVKNVVDEMGVRPSIPDLIKLYFLVGIGALVIEQISDLEFGDAIPAVGTIAGKSAVQGIGAALITLRVGYLAKAYLIQGQNKNHKKGARRWARLKISNVMMSGMSELPKNLAKKIESVLPSFDIGKIVKRTHSTTPELESSK